MNYFLRIKKNVVVRSFLVMLFVFLTGGILYGQPVSQTFNTSGTYTVPAGYSAIVTIEAWGAGAGGGSGAAERGGGGGGAYASSTTTLSAGSYTVTIGTGGAVGAVGGNSSFTSLVIGAGGSSTTTATGGAGGTVAASIGTIRFAGGAGGNAGNSNSAGGGGGGSATSSAIGGAGGTGLNGNNATGGVGGTGQGNGGAGSENTNLATAVAGTAPGGGGGGRASNATTSAAGANGRVIVTVNTVLPVKISNIKAFEKLQGIQIDWTTYSEENLSKYQVERSADGLRFSSIGEVAARNITAASNYGFFDANPLLGVSFYRLRSVDLDGKFAYSSIVKVNLDKSNKEITIYPNPATGGFVALQSADLSKGNYSVKLFNAGGQQVYTQRFIHTGGSINQTIQLPAVIKSGMYTMQLDNDGLKVMSKVFMVQ